MTGIPLIPLIALLPSIHYGDIVDEHRDQKDYKPISHWRVDRFGKTIPLFSLEGIYNINVMLQYKLYGAWMFNNPIWDRLSVILMHAMAVSLIEIKFGTIAALLFATAPMTLFCGVWRNGRRYALGNIISVAMAILGPLGLLIYPIMRYAHIGGIPACLMYVVTGGWAFSLMSCAGLVVFIKLFKRSFNRRSKRIPRFLYTFHRAKVVLFFKSMAFFFYKALVPAPVFMYEAWAQSYGVDKEKTRGFFKKDGWFYVGIILFVLVLAALWYSPTRFGAWWFLIFFIPYSNLVTNHQHNASRYCILPAIGIYAVLTAILPWWVFMPIIVGNFAMLVFSMDQFTNDEHLYNFHFKYSPKSIAPYFIVGQHHVKNRNAAQAELLAKAGLKYAPDHYGLHLVLAHIDNQDGQRERILQRMRNLIPFQIFKRKKFLNEQLSTLENMGKK